MVLLAGCTSGPSTAAGPSTTTSTPAAATPTPTPTPTPTVEWRDAESLIIQPGPDTPATLPHGPSWVTSGGHFACSIYDDWSKHDATTGSDSPAIYYGCRIDDQAATFTYPPFDDPGRGQIGGCPSGFAAYAGAAVTPLCSSGQVFMSETDHSNVLQPGQGVRFAGVTCVATGVDAMRCTDGPHGFTASLETFTLS
ncbi:MAG: hypothetical protein AAGC66_15590 [Leifsonia sp.]